MKNITLAVVLIIILGSFVVYGTMEKESDANIVFLLQPHHHLNVGSAITYQGVKIGEIEAIGFDQNTLHQPPKIAEAIIAHAYFPLLYQEMTFVLSRDRSRSGWWYVDALDTEVSTKTPLTNGERLSVSTTLEIMIDDTKRFLDDVIQEVKPLRENLQNRIIEGIKWLNEKMETSDADAGPRSAI